ncbi:NADH-quinone oxidoreductase subunit C [Streptomyces sp. ACA25]|uniref:NADH-quinone oxidoreductase subunit C n=1 Tax=Streptomyces sp. ACA25 TaxID=3022596 RepID=UPI002307D542|nr:NADH-quinone oxidoreductase subunit C [Streptomyces sp. ACA25]MDB1090359.1 NADH-quinone oxidoreductase subunit C [Streptomyces sp. ACA25]
MSWLPNSPEELFGEGASASDAYGLLTVEVPAAAWVPALETARDTLGCTFFDWLSAVDEQADGFQVCAHLVALGTPPRRLLLRTTVPHDEPALPTATGVYAGAAWHERETREMFGIGFPGHPHPEPLLLPETFEGHPLRKDFVLAARVVKAWPGAKEPGESAHGGPKRRQMLPPGVPDPNEWGPLKGTFPDAPARPARGRGGAAPGERPARRARTAGEGPARRPAAADAARPERQPASAESPAPAEPTEPPDARKPAPRSPDAPWHDPRPAGEETGRPAERPADPPPAPGEKPAPGEGSADGDREGDS